MKIKDLDNIVVISIYDCGYNCSLMENGVVHEKYYDGTYAENEIVEEASKAAMLDAFSKISNISKLKEMFPNKTIIICEDGGIEVIK